MFDFASGLYLKDHMTSASAQYFGVLFKDRIHRECSYKEEFKLGNLGQDKQKSGGCCIQWKIVQNTIKVRKQ